MWGGKGIEESEGGWRKGTFACVCLPFDKLSSSFYRIKVAVLESVLGEKKLFGEKSKYESFSIFCHYNFEFCTDFARLAEVTQNSKLWQQLMLHDMYHPN